MTFYAVRSLFVVSLSCPTGSDNVSHTGQSRTGRSVLLSFLTSHLGGSGHIETYHAIRVGNHLP